MAIYLVEEFLPLPGLGYYSLRAEDANTTMTAEFFAQLAANPGLATPAEVESFAQQLLYLPDEHLDLLAYERRGHRSHGVLRDESRAAALPAEPFYVRNHPLLSQLEFNRRGGLRLYCYPAASQVLVLFGGGYKTRLNPLDCPNVQGPFRFALRAAAALDAARLANEWRCEGTQLLALPPPLELNLR